MASGEPVASSESNGSTFVGGDDMFIRVARFGESSTKSLEQRIGNAGKKIDTGITKSGKEMEWWNHACKSLLLILLTGAAAHGR